MILTWELYELNPVTGDPGCGSICLADYKRYTVVFRSVDEDLWYAQGEQGGRRGNSIAFGYLCGTSAK